MKKSDNINRLLRLRPVTMILLSFIICHLSFSGCARMGSPDGGWYDEQPPRIIGSNPAEQATNVTAKKVTIYFDEYIKLADASQNVIVSPPQLEMPDIKEAGKKIVVSLKDTLKANTTYTIDFSDAISDNNEGNPLGNYTYTFSTGEKIDTFEVAGYVIEAENLEPVQGILVGLYDDLTDSAFQTKPMLRVARTDENGHFAIRGVAPGEYRVYALQDADGNYMFTQKSEKIAFSYETYKPSAALDTRQDTIWCDSLHIDSIARVPYMHFYPDDVVLLAFQEKQTDRYLLKVERKEANRITMFFTVGNDQLPVIRGLDFETDSAFILEHSLKNDTLTYWLRDTMMVNRDTLTFAMDYLATDTLGHLVSRTDTIEALAKTPYAKRLKAQQKEYEAWQKAQEKKKKREEPYDSIYPTKPLEIRYTVPQSMSPNGIVNIESPTPLASLDTAAIHLYSKIDTLWYRAPFEFRPSPHQLRRFELMADWHPDTEYSFEVDTLAFTDIYGQVSAPYKQGIKVRSLDEFATVVIEVSGLQDSTIIVELLDKSDKMVQQASVERDGTAQFFYVSPGVYYIRAFVDSNSNGQWDTGDYATGRQAEAVYYCPQEFEAKARWNITRQWNMTAQSRHHQKPAALSKKKSKKRTVKNRNADRARELGIEYVKSQEIKVKR